MPITFRAANPGVVPPAVFPGEVYDPTLSSLPKASPPGIQGYQKLRPKSVVTLPPPAAYPDEVYDFRLRPYPAPASWRYYPKQLESSAFYLDYVDNAVVTPFDPTTVPPPDQYVTPRYPIQQLKSSAFYLNVVEPDPTIYPPVAVFAPWDYYPKWQPSVAPDYFNLTDTSFDTSTFPPTLNILTQQARLETLLRAASFYLDVVDQAAPVVVTMWTSHTRTLWRYYPRLIQPPMPWYVDVVERDQPDLLPHPAHVNPPPVARLIQGQWFRSPSEANFPADITLPVLPFVFRRHGLLLVAKRVQPQWIIGLSGLLPIPTPPSTPIPDYPPDMGSYIVSVTETGVAVAYRLPDPGTGTYNP